MMPNVVSTLLSSTSIFYRIGIGMVFDPYDNAYEISNLTAY